MRPASDATLPKLPHGDPGMVEATKGFTECSPTNKCRRNPYTSSMRFGIYEGICVPTTSGLLISSSAAGSVEGIAEKEGSALLEGRLLIHLDSASQRLRYHVKMVLCAYAP
jgi:hypothetical protein